jgi:hypothetical protein
MSYSLRGRLQTRLTAALLPLLAAAALASALPAWWPLELAAAMIGIGAALDAAVYHPLLRYQAAWLALPLGLMELGLVLVVVYAFDVAAPLVPGLAFFAGSWLLTQALVHAVFPLRRLSWAEDGGELGRAGALGAASVAAILALAGGVAWASQPPTVRLERGVHRGPLVLDHELRLVGENGAVVRGGIRITADDVTVRGVRVEGGEYGIEIQNAQRVVLDDVTVVGASLDGIHARRSSVAIRDCSIHGLRGSYAQAIDISFAFDLPPSLVEDCTIVGGLEGIVTHFAHAEIRDNRVRATSLRAIATTEMSMGLVRRNDVRGALGVGIFCGDYSECRIEENRVAKTRPDRASGDRSRLGYGIVAHYGARAVVSENTVTGSRRAQAAFLGAHIEREEDSD